MNGTHAPSGATTRELIFAAQLENPDALEQLLMENEGLVRAAASRVVGPVGDFDNYVQDARLEFVAAVKDYQHHLGASFSTYAYHRMVRAVTKAVTKSRNASERFAPLVLGASNKKGATPEPPDTEWPLEERVGVRDAVDRLPVEDRILVRDLYWNGLPQADIARTRGISQQAISKRHRVILSTLRSALGT